ncbi:PLP-dependent transferase [Aureobasidium subglaciale]|nr:PLP-dependent transferase [Aureobasidium subglaciale]
MAGNIEEVSTMECGTEPLKRQFLFDPAYRNLNHGSFGTFPRVVRDALRHSQDECEAKPDAYIRYAYPKALDVSREAVARLINAPVDTCVFVPNATTGVNTVLRNLMFAEGDVILYFSTIYGACEKTVSYIVETTSAEAVKIDDYTYPVSDDDLCDAFEKAVARVKASGRRTKVAIFDTIVSLPGVRVPFERLISACRSHDILSLVDGAHGIGHIPLDLTKLNPDFFVSNCHKWLYTPRGCALLYVPERNQGLIRSTLPTSHGFDPLPTVGAAPINNPLPPSAKSAFIVNFEFVGTIDNSPYTSLPAAVEFRETITWQDKNGEDAIISFTQNQARKAGKLVADILQTVVMENAEGTLGRCNFSNVKLPLDPTALAGGETGKAVKIAQWIATTLVEQYNTFIAIIYYGDAWWVRLSAQVYLTMEDWEWAGTILNEICERVRKGEVFADGIVEQGT